MSHYTALVPINANNLTLGYKKVNEKAFKTNMLGLCVFSLVLGFAILHLESKAENVKKLLEETNAIIMKILMTLIK
jgi:Na+/H+-dicarboxylate symporter